MLRLSTAIVVLLVVACVATAPAHAQFGESWRRTPRIVVVGPQGDARRSLVEEAVAFWNRTLEDLGSGFRLGPVEQVVQTVPEDALQSLSDSVLEHRWGLAQIPRVLRHPPGDITIYLSASDLVSFTGPFDTNSRLVVGIRALDVPPLNLPNVARNVIAHELGHAIGLSHNGDPATLMCGRPASCRPNLFRSDEPRIFPLTEDDKRQLLKMYPAAWKAR